MVMLIAATEHESEISDSAESSWLFRFTILTDLMNFFDRIWVLFTKLRLIIIASND